MRHSPLPEAQLAHRFQTSCHDTPCLHLSRPLIPPPAHPPAGRPLAWRQCWGAGAGARPGLVLGRCGSARASGDPSLLPGHPLLLLAAQAADEDAGAAGGGAAGAGGGADAGQWCEGQWDGRKGAAAQVMQWRW